MSELGRLEPQPQCIAVVPEDICSRLCSLVANVEHPGLGSVRALLDGNLGPVEVDAHSGGVLVREHIAQVVEAAAHRTKHGFLNSHLNDYPNCGSPDVHIESPRVYANTRPNAKSRRAALVQAHRTHVAQSKSELRAAILSDTTHRDSRFLLENTDEARRSAFCETVTTIADEIGSHVAYLESVFNRNPISSFVLGALKRVLHQSSGGKYKDPTDARVQESVERLVHLIGVARNGAPELVRMTVERIAAQSLGEFESMLEGKYYQLTHQARLALSERVLHAYRKVCDQPEVVRVADPQEEEQPVTDPELERLIVVKEVPTEQAQIQVSDLGEAKNPFSWCPDKQVSLALYTTADGKCAIVCRAMPKRLQDVSSSMRLQDVVRRSLDGKLTRAVHAVIEGRQNAHPRVKVIDGSFEGQRVYYYTGADGLRSYFLISDSSRYPDIETALKEQGHDTSIPIVISIAEVDKNKQLEAYRFFGHKGSRAQARQKGIGARR